MPPRKKNKKNKRLSNEEVVVFSFKPEIPTLEGKKFFEHPQRGITVQDAQQTMLFGESAYTKGTLIEGDNLVAMHLLLDEYEDGVDFIFADPPYNTGQMFTYDDTYDSNWCGFMYPRLELMHDLLKEDGVIAISIDDCEQATLKLLMDKVFGKDNFIATMIWHNALKNQSKLVNSVHEYIHIYAKNKNAIKQEWSIPRDPRFAEELHKLVRGYLPDVTAAKKALNKRLQEIVAEDDANSWIRNYSNVDDKGRVYFTQDLSVPGKPNRRELKNGVVLEPLSDRAWQTEAAINKLIDERRVAWKDSRPYKITYLDEARDSSTSLIDKVDLDGAYRRIYTRRGKQVLKDIFKERKDVTFDYAKPVELIEYLLTLANISDEAVILDPFAGSGTTAHAVLERNAKDNGHRQFICITTNEENICRDITHPRIERVMRGYTDRKGNHIGSRNGEVRYLALREPYAKNNRSTLEYITEAMQGKGEMHYREITKAILDAGWTTTSKTPEISVNVYLNGNDQFVKTGTGKFALRD